MKSYKELIVWQKSFELTKSIYNLTKQFPKEETYGMVSQMRRAAISIPSNIAEGYSRNKSVKDKINFLNDALGSNEEMLFNLEFMKDANLISQKDFQEFYEEYTICGKQLYRLINTLK